MNQLIKTVAEFVSSTNFLYPATIIVALLSIAYNVTLFLEYRKVIKKVEIARSKNIPKEALRYLHKALFFTLRHSIIVNVILGITVLSLVLCIIVPQPKVTYPLDPALGYLNITPEQPLKISFDRPINIKELKYEMSPVLEGEWKFSNTVAPNSFYFYPKVTPDRETRYQISLTQIKNLIGGGGINFLFSFQAPALPEVVSIAPIDGDQGVLPNQELNFELSEEAGNSVLIEYLIDPPIESEIKNDGKKYTVTPKVPFKKGSTYTLAISRTPQKYNFETKEKKVVSEKQEISKTSFKIIDAPGVAAYAPIGSGILVDTSITVTFRQNMNREATQSAFSVSPEVQGNLSWTDDRNIIFKPSSPLAKNTKYSVKISTTAKAQDDSPFEEELNFEFTTIGYVTASISPGNGAKNASISAGVSVTFNQDVDHGSAESKFALSPATQGSFSWKGNTLYFNHSNFAYSTGYAITVSAGIKSINGLDSSQNFSSNFTTQSQTVVLNVPSYRQTHNYSCMASAARQALAYRGVNVSEDTIINLIGYSQPTSFSGTWKGADAVWGDPYAGVVGNVDGRSGGLSWGYGAYWGPTSRAISSYRSNEVKSGWSVQGIAQEIANGNPVMVWWVNGVWVSEVVNWRTPAGTNIRGVTGLHVQVVKGFTGTVDNPTSFIVNDSGYGYPSRTFDVNTFKAKWSWFGNTAIVVR